MRDNTSINDPTRVLIVEDHAMIAHGLQSALDGVDDLEVVGLATRIEEGERMAQRLAPHVVIMDFRLPDGEAPEAIQRLATSCPTVKVLVVSAASDHRSVLRAMEAGAAGYLLKDQPLADLVAGIRGVRVGETALAPAVLPKLLARIAPSAPGAPSLTRREIEILQLLAEGHTNAELAGDLHLSVNTVRNHVQSILTNLGAHSKLEAVAVALREGIIKPPESAPTTRLGSR